jgi:hypothetical protein
MLWWQLINFENPDDEFRLVRNIYIYIYIYIYRSFSVGRITFSLNRYPQEALTEMSGFGVVTIPVVTTMAASVGIQTQHHYNIFYYFTTMVAAVGYELKPLGL